MTNDEMRAIRDDIAFMKALAEEGRSAPMRGGLILVAAGLLFGAASLVHWSIATGVLNVPPISLLLTWLAAAALFFVALTVISRRLRNQPGANTTGNRASGIAWAAAGWSIFAIGIAFFIASARNDQWIIMDLYAPVVVALYGGGWAVTASMTRTKWLWWVSIGSFAAAAGLGWLAGDADIYLAYAAALFLLAFVPGLVLARREPSDIV